MSDLSEELDTALNGLGAKEKGQWVNIEDETFRKEIPGFDGFQRHNAKSVVNALRRVYRRQAGSALPETPQEAIDKTEEMCTNALVPVCRAAFADGVQVGQGISHAVKKFSFFKKLDRVFENDGFRSESEVFEMTIQMDYETSEAIERYFRAAATMVAGASGFMAITEKQTLNRVWDLWALSCSSAATGLYMAGIIVGQQWRERDTLAGIAAVTEKGDDDA